MFRALVNGKKALSAMPLDRCHPERRLSGNRQRPVRRWLTRLLMQQWHKPLLETRNFVIAICLTVSIEELDPSIQFEDSDLERISNLNNIADLVEQQMKDESYTHHRVLVATLVRAPVRKVFANIDPKEDIPLDDAFGNQTGAMRSWFFRNWCPSPT